MNYTPQRIFFEQDSLEYPLGKQLYDYFSQNNFETKILKSHNRVTGIPGKTPQQAYTEGKNTLVVGTKKSLNFSTCKPSAHYQLPLSTSCAGKCEYCYLNTQLGKKPYIRIYVNIDEILDKTQKYINERSPETTVFEGAATSDPLIVEQFTNSLQRTIDFFSKQEYGKFRFVTKFANIESLLNINHNNNTTIRFSINSENIINQYEHATPKLEDRLEASSKIIKAGYPIGFIIAPVFLDKGWENDYYNLLKKIQNKLKNYEQEHIAFEIISHRYTQRAKKNILQIFEKSTLPMNKENRRFKYGQFGYGKYVYNDELLQNMEKFFKNHINNLFPNATIKYII